MSKVKRVIHTIMVGSLLLTAMPSYSAFSLSSTRVVMQAQSSASVEVFNGSDSRYGMQAWVEDQQGKDPGKGLAVTPSLSAVDANKSTVLRLLSFSTPTDKELLYYLNVQEIPPKSKDNGRNEFSLAVRTKIKVLVRPAGLFDKRRGAEEMITATKSDKGLIFNNPTPYYFAITTITVGNKNYTKTPLGTFAPGSTVKVALNPVPSKVTLRYLEDTGAAKTTTVSVK
jgi:chaperone protein EcpD